MYLISFLPSFSSSWVVHPSSAVYSSLFSAPPVCSLHSYASLVIIMSRVTDGLAEKKVLETRTGDAPHGHVSAVTHDVSRVRSYLRGV